MSNKAEAGARVSESNARPRDPSVPFVSVVVPIYNEEECLDALYDRLKGVLEKLGDNFEIVLVNDGSRDRSLEVIRRLAANDPRIAYSSFTRNFGHESATTCGLLQARGQAIVLIDADLQDPPELIPELVETWRNGYDIVYAQRRSRAGESLLTRSTSFLFYRLFARFSKVSMPVDTGDYRLMDRAVVDAFKKLGERNRFVRGMVSWTGFKQTSVLYDRDSRLAGQTKYHFFNRLRLAFDAICSMSTTPLRWITYIGFNMTALSFVAGLAVVVHRIWFGLDQPGYALLTAGMFFLGSVQLLTLGLLGEYLGRIYVEVQQRPLFLIAEQRDSASESRNPSHGSAAV